MSNFTKGNTMNNLRATDLDMDAFNEVVKNLRNTHKAVVDFGKDRPEVEVRLEEVRSELQQALNRLDTDAVSKLNAEAKRIVAKLSELPTEKIVAFDTAVNEFKAFIDSMGATEETMLSSVDSDDDEELANEAA